MDGCYELQPDGEPTILDQYRIGSRSIFVIGSLNKGLTIKSQQVRALNLVWALVRSPLVETCGNNHKARIAIVGGGFAGLTAAAALIRKDVNADISIFERCDTAIPLQHGSDTRWVHPHIYDWPLSGSEAASAALPVLNWTASRASDAVMQVMQEWTATVENYGKEHGYAQDVHDLQFYCNAKELQVSASESGDYLLVGCTADRRQAARPWVSCQTMRGKKITKECDIVILAIGFGLEHEQNETISYWRNEVLAQPNLSTKPSTYIVSGSGDGAFLDMFRLCISTFRQDQILAELFEEHEYLLAEFRRQEENQADRYTFLNNYYREAARGEMAAVSDVLRRRLRHDTSVIWHTRPQGLQQIFQKKLAFQNCLLVFLLEKIKAFTWSTESLDLLKVDYDVPPERIVKRYGTDPGTAIKDVLIDQPLRELVDEAVEDPNEQKLRQNDVPRWTGGFFDFPGAIEPESASDEVRAKWRKEYLPGPTEAISATFCSAVAGLLAKAHPENSRLRVVMHRTLILSGEVVLQQCCEYQGIQLHDEPLAYAARTFRVNTGTSGFVYATGKVVCTKDGAEPSDIYHDMKILDLNGTSRNTSSQVASLVAIPMISVGGDGRRVVGVLYADSYVANFFQDDRILSMVEMTKGFMKSLAQVASVTAGTLENDGFERQSPAEKCENFGLDRADQLKALHVSGISGPAIPRVPYLNVDHSSFRKVIKL